MKLIKCSERWPELDKRVMAHVTNDRWISGKFQRDDISQEIFFCSDFQFDYINIIFSLDNVIAWAELPEEI